jgi:hypothetical protein
MNKFIKIIFKKNHQEKKMKNQMKSIVKLVFAMLVVTLFISQSSFTQGKGFGSKSIKSGTGTTTGLKWIDANGDGICDNFVDANGDGINDNPKGYRGGKSGSVKPTNRVGRFGSASGVCDGTGKGRIGTQNRSNTLNKSK